MATQVRVAGLVSFTTKVSSVTSTSGGSEQGGEGEDCSQFCMHSHPTLVDTYQSLGARSANSPNTCSSVVMLPDPTSFTAEQV